MQNEEAADAEPAAEAVPLNDRQLKFRDIFEEHLPDLARALKQRPLGYHRSLRKLSFEILDNTESDWIFRVLVLYAGVVANVSPRDAGDLAKRIAPVYRKCGPGSDTRVTSITIGLGQHYVGEFDLDQLHQRIEETFEWHRREHRDYLSPSFAMIQSSGMGKTRLLKEYKRLKQRNNCVIFTLLCTTNDNKPDDYRDHFDGTLDVPAVTRQRERESLEMTLDLLVNTTKHEAEREQREVTKMVLLFDECQLLINDESGGYYACIHWWLRTKRSWTAKIVAVFAGTSLSLANHEQQALHYAWEGFSRDGRASYVNFDWNTNKKKEKKKKFYEPFFTLTTVSMHHSNEAGPAPPEDELYDIQKCGRHGRPLFATMLDETGDDALALKSAQCLTDGAAAHICDSNRLHAILRRILLSKPRWADDLSSVASVLATRVQMGVSSFKFASEATSSGYAMLVDYQGGENRTASIVFPPDPVCAALAMGLMQENWSVSSVIGTQIQGKKPEFWVNKAAACFEQTIFLPSEIDTVEVFAALYMLLCGDELRKRKDSFMRRFEIGLFDWLKRLYSKLEWKVAHEGGSSPTLNFIQVCRNHCRSHSWLEGDSLKFMYESATACYTYMNCPAVDLVFPIKVGEQFHPCLVTVRCWEDFIPEMAEHALDDIKEAKDAANHEVVCFGLLIVIGCSPDKEVPAPVGVFPKEDAYCAIVVGEKDFGISEAFAAAFAPQSQNRDARVPSFSFR